jgi:hypothetical protein
MKSRDHKAISTPVEPAQPSRPCFDSPLHVANGNNADVAPCSMCTHGWCRPASGAGVTTKTLTIKTIGCSSVNVKPSQDGLPCCCVSGTPLAGWRGAKVPLRTNGPVALRLAHWVAGSNPGAVHFSKALNPNGEPSPCTCLMGSWDMQEKHTQITTYYLVMCPIMFVPCAAAICFRHVVFMWCCYHAMLS